MGLGSSSVVLGRFRGCGFALAIILLLGALIGAAPEAEAAASRDEVKAALEDVLEGGRYQTEMEPQQPQERPSARWRLPDWVAEALVWIGRAILLAGAVALAVFLGREIHRLGYLRRDGGLPGDEPAAAEAPGDVAILSATLGEADRLAREGAYSEAIHVLLLAGIEALRRRLQGGIAASLTCHEILRARALSESLREPLGRLVQAAELSYFGGRAFAQADYQGCRNDYVTFLEAAETS